MYKSAVNLDHVAFLSDCIHGNSLSRSSAEWYEEWKDVYASQMSHSAQYRAFADVALTAAALRFVATVVALEGSGAFPELLSKSKSTSYPQFPELL